MTTFTRLAASLVLAAGSRGLMAQQPAQRVTLRVVALDSANKPVPDLTESDFKIFDNGSRQQIASFRLNQADRPGALVILFDLMNANFNSRGEVADNIKASLAHLPGTGPIYLYLLVEDGSLYPVHALRGAEASQQASNGWLEDLGPQLDAALRKTVQQKPQDIRVDPMVRFKTTCNALEEMGTRIAALPGSKELLWATYGIPSTVFEPQTNMSFDGGPVLRHLGAWFIQYGITIYSVDPGINLNRGVLSRDGLDILTGATGGRAFEAIKISQAIAQAEADAGLNYSLEYQPPARNWDGKYHKLRVTVDRKGIRLQTERGYFAEQGS
jgi:VWFA-related protein